jgi:nitroimidazol reductase NimA-like FMN-containing flavoprotein (pyridoxamine 5'-phosphate oxidase superfamily)
MQFIEQDFDIKEFLRRPLFAHVATLGDCGPCETPVWFLWEDGALWIIASSASSLPKRLAKDERAAIGIVDFDLERGFLQHLGFRGVATVAPMDQGRRTRLVRRYLGHEDQWNLWFKESVVDRQDVLVKFIPDSAVARDQSYFRLGNASNKVKR